MIAIEDSIHCEQTGDFKSFEDAIAELTRRAAIPWDQPPNQAPCQSWKNCGREYAVSEFDVSHSPWTLRRSVEILKISANGVEWMNGFDEKWVSLGK